MSDNGGPAFPVVEQQFRPGSNGMSLRDWFAGQALMSMLNTPEKIGPGTYAVAAELSYKFADAMLTARNKDAPND